MEMMSMVHEWVSGFIVRRVGKETCRDSCVLRNTEWIIQIKFGQNFIEENSQSLCVFYGQHDTAAWNQLVSGVPNTMEHHKNHPVYN